MKTLRGIIVAIITCLGAAPEVFAAETNRVYNSGILVIAFLGFSALVVVVQMIPALLTLWSIAKELVSGRKSREVEAKVEVRH